MSSLDFFRNLQPLFESKDDDQHFGGDKTEKELKKNPGSDIHKPNEKKDKKPANVKETAGDFFRRYSDIIAEAEKSDEDPVTESWGDDDDEDPDVAKAEKVKGKDGKTQKDSEGGKKWNFEKADKKAEDKGAKALKKDKEAFADSKAPRKPMLK